MHCERHPVNVILGASTELSEIIFLPVQRHRGMTGGREPGHTRDTWDTRAHTGTRITQTNLTSIQTHQHTRTTARRLSPRPTQQPASPGADLSRYRISLVPACDSSVLSCRQMFAVANDSALRIQLCEKDLLVSHLPSLAPTAAPRVSGARSSAAPCGPAAEALTCYLCRIRRAPAALPARAALGKALPRRHAGRL